MNDRKRQVLLAAQHLFIEKGFTSTSVQDILDESRISKGTFYNYFTSKNECLMAILEQAHDDALIRRRELLIGQDITDKTILVEQIVIRLLVNREHNLLPIFEAVFHSGDDDLRDFIRRHHLNELSWLTERLIDVFGPKSSPYAPDCAVIFIGMMQHFIHFCASGSKKEFDGKNLVSFCMRRIDALMQEMMASGDTFLNKDVFENLEQERDDQTGLKNRLITQLTGFLGFLEDDSRQNGIQYTRFLLDEIHSDQPRLFLLETVSRSFRETFSATRHEPEALELIAILWRYIDLMKKDGN